MAAIRIYRRLQDLQDVDPNGLPDQGVPKYDTNVSSFVVETIAAGGGGSFSLGASNIGNTLGDTGVTGTRVVLAGVGNLTLSQATDANGGTISISGGTAGAGGVAISASNSLFSSGTVVLTGAGGGATVNTVAPGTIQISVAAPVAQSVQTQNRFNLTLDGNTDGVLQEVSSGTLTLAGGSNITLSQNGNAITVIGASAASETQTAISGIANSQTTYSSGTVKFSELGAVTIRSTTGNQFQISVNSQSVQPETQTFIGGVAGSNTTYTSGTVNITGSGIVTVQSGTGQRIIINASQSVQPETQTFVGGIAASNTTYTSGTITISGVGGGVTVNSNTGQRVDISVAAPVAQTGTQFSAGLTNSGNTSGDTGTVAGRLLLVGTNNITLSGSTNGASMTITMSGPSVAGAQTGISGIANSQTTYTSGTVSLSELGAITIRSTTGNQFQFSVNSQTVQTQGILSAGVSTGGNTSGNTTVNTGSRLVFVGSNNITLSEGTAAGAMTITISGPSAQTGISGIANSQTTYTSGTVSLSELGAITIRSTTGNQYQFSVNAQTGTQFSAGISGGNTSGDTGTVAGRVVFAGGNNITLSGSTNGVSETITISAGAGGAFSGGVSSIGNTAGNTGITGSQLVLSGGQSITLSQSTNASGATVGISGASTSQSVQTQGILNVALSNVGNTSGDTGINSGTRYVLAGGNNITLSGSSAANATTVTISAANQSVQTQGVLSVGASTGGNTAGNTTVNTGSRLVFVGSNNITVSQGTAAGATTLTLSGPTQTGTQFSAGISGGNTSGDTGTVAGRVVLAGGNNITLSGSTNGVSETITISAFNQTVESQSIGASNLGNTLGTSGVASGGQVRAVIIGTSNITVSQSVNGASATMSLIGQPSFSAGVSTGGNTQGNTGVSGTRLVLVGTNNITLSQNTDASGATVSISGPAPGAAQYSIGASNLGNTAGSTGVTGTRIVFVGTNNLSLSQSTDATGATISFNNTVSAGSAGVSTIGNTAGDTGVTGTRLVLAASGAMTASQATGANGATITLTVPATSSLSGVSGIKISTTGSTISIGYGQPQADWENMPRAQASLLSHVSAFSKTPIYWNDHLDGDLTAKSLAFAISMVTASQPLSVSAHLGLYTFVNSTSAALLGSVSEAYVVSSASSVSLSGVRNLIMTGIGTHTALSNLTYGEYLIGMMFSATATNAMNFSILGASGGAGPLGGIYPGTNQLSTATSQGIQTLQGRGSVTVNALPANLGASDLINQGTGASMALHPWIYIRS